MRTQASAFTAPFCNENLGQQFPSAECPRIFTSPCRHLFLTVSSTKPTMLTRGILNPQLLSLLARVRHTNSLVIADWAFPSWPGLETVDLSLTYGIPTVLQVVTAIRETWKCGEIYMAQEFMAHNDRRTRTAFAKACGGAELKFELHVEFKKRVPGAIGLIRTGDATVYSNMILVSA
jgi:D-ribose pyranase